MAKALKPHKPCWHFFAGLIACCHCLHEKAYSLKDRSPVWEVIQKPKHLALAVDKQALKKVEWTEK